MWATSITQLAMIMNRWVGGYNKKCLHRFSSVKGVVRLIWRGGLISCEQIDGMLGGHLKVKETWLQREAQWPLWWTLATNRYQTSKLDVEWGKRWMWSWSEVHKWNLLRYGSSVGDSTARAVRSEWLWVINVKVQMGEKLRDWTTQSNRLLNNVSPVNNVTYWRVSTGCLPADSTKE